MQKTDLLGTKKITQMDLASLDKLLKLNEIRACVIGIGRIGLPTALTLANAKMPTIGVDINSELVNKIGRAHV